MSFFLRSGWYVSFLEPDLKTPLPRTFNFADADKIMRIVGPDFCRFEFNFFQFFFYSQNIFFGNVFLQLDYHDFCFFGTQMTRIKRICADKIFL